MSIPKNIKKETAGQTLVFLWRYIDPGPSKFSPYFSSAQAVPGSVVSGNSLYLCICVTRILAKMVLPELTFGEHFVEIWDCLRTSPPSVFMYFFSNETKCSWEIRVSIPDGWSYCQQRRRYDSTSWMRRCRYDKCRRSFRCTWNSSSSSLSWKC